MVRRKGTTADLLKQPEADLVVDYVINRKKKGLYSLIFVAGLPGTGKTSTCFRLGELISEAYLNKNIMKAENIVDSFLDLTEAVIKSDPKELSLIVIEEVSVLFPSRRAMSGGNVDLGKLLDTCRKKQVIILANAPIWTSIDSHMKALGNIYVQTKKIYKIAAIVYSKMYILQTDPRTGKTYTHSFHRAGKDVKKMYTFMPNLEEWNKYEGKKDTFMENLYRRLRMRERARLDKEKKQYGGDSMKRQVKPLTNLELEIYDCYYRQKMKPKEIGERKGCLANNISQKLRVIRQKLQITHENKENTKEKSENDIITPILEPIK